MSVTNQSSRLNLCGEKCPMAFVKAKLFLDMRAAGQVVELIIDNNKANEPLPRSIEEAGHQILSIDLHDADTLFETSSSHNSKLPNKSNLKVLLVKVQVKK